MFLTLTNKLKTGFENRKCNYPNYRNQEIASIPELDGLDNSQQVEVISDHYSKVTNLYEPVKHFEEYLARHSKQKPPIIGLYKVNKTIKKINSATIPGK